MQIYLIYKLGKSGKKFKYAAVFGEIFGYYSNYEFYNHVNFDDSEEGLCRMEEFRKTQGEVEKKNLSKLT